MRGLGGVNESKKKREGGVGDIILPCLACSAVLTIISSCLSYRVLKCDITYFSTPIVPYGQEYH